MWGSRADTYRIEAVKASSMKWHLVAPESIEEREIPMGGYYKTLDPYRPKIKRMFGALMCGGKKQEWMVFNQYSDMWFDIRIPLVLKETVNLNGSGICVYCKNFRLKQLGKDEKVMG